MPMVPPWVPDPPQAGAVGASPLPEPSPAAPAGRFAGARRELGSFARSADREELRRGIGHYVRTGYGGSATAARRFGGTAATAGSFGALLGSLAAPPTATSVLDRALLAGRSADEIIAAVVDAVRPVDGTQDAEAARSAMMDAMSEVLTRYPDADLLNLTDTERSYAIETFVAMDVYRRACLDIGLAIQQKAGSATEALSRLKEVRDYIKETVAASFRASHALQAASTASAIAKAVRDALQETFDVFESYVR